VEPLKPISHSLYLCDNRFHTDFLRNQLTAGETRVGFVVMDGHSASLHLLVGTTKETLAKLDVDLPNKQGRGGQSQNRFERMRVEKRGWYVSKVLELFNQHFTQDGLLTVSFLIFAGCAGLKNDLAKKLEPKIFDKILAFVDTQYGGEAGFSQAVELSAAVLKNTRFLYEQKTMENFFDKISRDGSYCYTPSSSMVALEGGLVETLIVWDHLSCFRIELESLTDPSDKKVVYKSSEESEFPGFVIVSTISLLDWILDHHSEFGTKLELVSSATSISNQFIEGFGGIGGILRFKFDETHLEEGGNVQSEEDEESEYEYVY